MLNIYGLKASGYDKNGEKFDSKEVYDLCLRMIKSESYFKRKAKMNTKDAQNAIDIVDDVEKRFSTSIKKLVDTEGRLIESSKRASSSVRKAADDMASGLLRIENAANFDNLERYVALLERASTAMTVLAELEKSGKLEKIACAIK